MGARVTTLNQRSFSGGEISPPLYSRVDLNKYQTGARTLRNMFTLRHGGAANRPGTLYVGEVKDSTKATRIIPFIFNDDQTYCIEMGESYFRFHKEGAQITETAQNITGVTQADPAVVTITAHGYANGEEVYFTGVVGMTELNNRNFKVANVTANTFEIQDMGGTNVDSTGYGAYSSGGTAGRVYEITSPYQEADLFEVKFVQSADVVTMAHPSYGPRELSRTTDTNWSVNEITFKPATARPDNLNLAIGPAGAVLYRYTVTAVDEETFEESLVATRSTAITISGITQANPAVVTATAHALNDNETIYIDGVVGMTELNDRDYIVSNVTANTFELINVDSTGYTAYSSAGSAFRTFTSASGGTPTSVSPHVVSWDRVPGAGEYNVYKESNGIFGLIGVAKDTTFNDINILPNTADTPPASRNPFVGVDNYPSAVTYIQQRLTFANTNSEPEKIFMSRTGNFKNFTQSNPLQDDDSITFTMAGRQVNAVEHLLDIGRLVVMTTGAEWSVPGGQDDVLTPQDINPRQHTYNGAGELPPVIIDGSAIYQQARGSIVRDLGFDFQIDGYKGNDITVFASHLFDKFTLVDWDYQQIPHSILWVARSDGKLLGLTFVKDQSILAWHQHDFGGDGLVESVASVPEGNEDTVYFVIRRTINGRSVRYIEKFSTRLITDIKQMKFMDSHLSLDGTNISATTMTLSGGSTWNYTEDLTLTASASFFSASDVGNQIHLTGSDEALIRCTIKSYTSGTEVTVNPHKTVPASMQAVAITAWGKAVDEISGLWHLEGEDVAVFADSFVAANPQNESYDVVTVADGKITLDKPYVIVHVGLPYFSDVETLDVDTINGETVADKREIIQRVHLFVEETRGVWAGAKPPSDDDTDPIEGLTEYKLRSTESYDSPVNLKTDKIQVNIQPEWNNNGRVFIRQIDPVPMTLLSVIPSGRIAFRG